MRRLIATAAALLATLGPVFAGRAQLPPVRSRSWSTTAR